MFYLLNSFSQVVFFFVIGKFQYTASYGSANTHCCSVYYTYGLAVEVLSLYSYIMILVTYALYFELYVRNLELGAP